MSPLDYTHHWFYKFGVAEKCSGHLMRQVANAYQSGACEPEMIAETIARVDAGKPTGLKRPERFRRSPLIGLWKFHVWTGGTRLLLQMATNLLNEDGHGMRKKRMSSLLNKYDGKLIDQEIIKLVANEVIDGGIEDRLTRNALTGDWIVFEKRATNRYLTVAEHSEQDQPIFERVERARAEFRTAPS